MAVEPFTINQIGHEIIQTRRIWRQGSNCSVKPRTSCRIDKGTVLHDLWTHCFDLVATYQHGYCRDCIFIALFLILFFDSVVFFVFSICYLLFSVFFSQLVSDIFRFLSFSSVLCSRAQIIFFSSLNRFGVSKLHISCTVTQQRNENICSFLYSLWRYSVVLFLGVNVFFYN